MVNNLLFLVFCFTPLLGPVWIISNLIKGPFHLQNESTGQNSTGQYKTEQHRTNIYDIKQILSCMIFDRKNVILVI